MAESMSFVGQTEIPMVYFVAQRPGPSTGLPTRTSQGDLQMALHAGQSDFVRIVLACGNHDDCVQLSAEAFNLADRYQVPVVVLTEKYLADMHKSVPMDIADGITVDRGEVVTSISDPAEYERFRDTESGVSPRVYPGTKNGTHTTTSYEHNAKGQPVEEVEDVAITIDKRWRKWDAITQALPAPKVYGNSPIKVLVWGGTTNPARSAQRILARDGIEIEIIQLQYLCPLKTEALQEQLSDAQKVVIIEGNQSGQLESLLREKMGLVVDNRIRLYYGRPFTGEYISTELASLLSA